jgi:5-hydroxyisourate hydrolase-like protein (transthyretin family)
MRQHLRSTVTLACLLPLALSGCDGIGISAPTKTVRLNITGMVTDAATGSPVAGAKVALTLDLWVQEIASVVTDSNGRYALTHTLRQVATDRELRDPCHVWTDDRARSVNLTVDAEAQGYAPHYDGLYGAPALRCVDILQVIDLALTRP